MEVTNLMDRSYIINPVIGKSKKNETFFGYSLCDYWKE